jgi:hypothetical protein
LIITLHSLHQATLESPGQVMLKNVYAKAIGRD